MLWLLQPQLPFMYNSGFDFPLPPLVHGFAADFESFVVAPLLLCKTRDAVGPRVEVSIASIVGWSMQVQTSTPRTSAAAHEWRLASLRRGLGIRVTPVLRLLVIIQPDDGAETWLLPVSETPLCRKAGLCSPSLA